MGAYACSSLERGGRIWRHVPWLCAGSVTGSVFYVACGIFSIKLEPVKDSELMLAKSSLQV